MRRTRLSPPFTTFGSTSSRGGTLRMQMSSTQTTRRGRFASETPPRHLQNASETPPRLPPRLPRHHYFCRRAVRSPRTPADTPADASNHTPPPQGFREEKRWMERQNEKLRLKRRREEKARAQSDRAISGQSWAISGHLGWSLAAGARAQPRRGVLLARSASPRDAVAGEGGARKRKGVAGPARGGDHPR